MSKHLSGLLAAVLLAGTALGATFTIDADGTGDYPTIQSAVDAAADGDVIVLESGTYLGSGNRDIDVLGKAITIRSLSGDPETCVIDCQGSESEPHRGFLFVTGETATTVLEGVTVTGGQAPDVGGDRAGSGILCGVTSPVIRNCIIRQNNGFYGAGLAASGSPTIDNCQFLENDSSFKGGALYFYSCSGSVANSTFVGNSSSDGGAIAVLEGGLPTIYNCRFTDNVGSAEGGAVNVTAADAVISYAVFHQNYAGHGSGVWTENAGVTLLNCTLVDNDGPYGGSVLSAEGASSLSLENTIVAFNLRISARTADGGHITAECTDIHGNVGGDWPEYIEGSPGSDGNIDLDPLLCDIALEYFGILPESPCAPDQSPCGLIGAESVGCALQSVAVEDVPDDQGGQVTVTWLRFPADDAAAPEPVTYYQVQRWEGYWNQLAVVAASESDTYLATVATDDVLVIGDPPPTSNYRVVAYTTNPLITFTSAAVAGYSVDNIAPPAPVASLQEFGDVVLVSWEQPQIPDLLESCVFGGTAADFEPEEPLVCTTETGFVDDHEVMFYYVVRFTDIHGNHGEFSAVVHSTSTAADDGTPRVLTLQPARPNPFNPTTALAFFLPRAGEARLAVFDLHGRRIASLVDADLPAGRHELLWHGRDENGRAAPSGIYLARLQADRQTLTTRLTLVR